MSNAALLIVSQDRLLRYTLRERFSSTSLYTHFASTSKQALELAHDWKPSCIVIDEGSLTEDPCQLAQQLKDSLETVSPYCMLVVLSKQPIAHRTAQYPNGVDFVRRYGRFLVELQAILANAFPYEFPQDTYSFGPRPMHGKVVCVDADKKFTRQLQIKLQWFGLTTIRVESAPEGFEAIVRHQPDLVISEFHLPRGLGSWIIGRMRGCDIQIPVIIATRLQTNAFAQFEANLIDLGAYAVLKKPLQTLELADIIEELLPLPEELFSPSARRSYTLSDVPHHKVRQPHVFSKEHETEPAISQTNESTDSVPSPHWNEKRRTSRLSQSSHFPLGNASENKSL